MTRLPSIALVGLSVILLAGFTGCGPNSSSQSGSGDGAKNPPTPTAKGEGYTDRVLRLDPKLLKKLRGGEPVREGTKPKYAPNTVADLLQALSILSGSPIRSVPGSDNMRKYGSPAKGWYPIPVWTELFGAPANVKSIRVEAGPRMTVERKTWTIECKDGSVTLVGDIRRDAAVAEGGLVTLSGVNWDTYLEEFCAGR